MNVLICDDLPEADDEFGEAVAAAKQGVTPKRLRGDSLKHQLNALIQHADRLLSGDGEKSELEDTAFDDDIDLVILDNNLAGLRTEGTRLTAEAVAGYIRAFTSASYIVSVNKNPEYDFDLRYLIGDYSTRTDLAVNADHLSNPALWTRERSDAKNGFLPWYWPRLLDAGMNRRTKIEFVERRLSKVITEVLGISTQNYRYLSRQARSILSQAEETRRSAQNSNNAKGETATLYELFLASNRSLPSTKERRALLDMRNKDIGCVETIVARTVAADLDLWLRRDIFGPQEVLVDIPHLLMRMPFLLGNATNDIDCWNSALDAAKEGPPFGLDQALFDEYLKDEVFDAIDTDSSPYLWWTHLRENDELNALFSKGNSIWADVVFCEDRSKFIPIGESESAGGPLEFVAQFESSWNRRYVAFMKGVRYAPKSRLAQ